MPAKTLHITNAYHPTSGGVSTFYRALLKEADAQGRQMRLIVPAERNGIEESGDYGRVYHVAANPSKVGDPRYRILWPWGKTGRQIQDILRVEQPDLVEIADKYTLPAIAGLLRTYRVPGMRRRPILVGTTHERLDDAVRTYIGTGAIGKLLSRYFMWQYYYPMFDWHIANSYYTQHELLQVSRGHRLHREMRVAPMGVDCDAFDPLLRTGPARSRLAERVGVSSTKRMLLYSGRLAAEKNLDLLPEMMRYLPDDYMMVIAGDGDQRRTLERNLGGRGHFTGHVGDRHDLAGLYAGADAFVHPNPREPFGIAPLEAMAAGLPLVAPDSGGVLSYANEENAWLTKPNGPAFAEAVKAVFSDRCDRERKVQHARNTAQQLRWPNVAARFFALYDEIVETGWPLEPPSALHSAASDHA